MAIMLISMILTKKVIRDTTETVRQQILFLCDKILDAMFSTEELTSFVVRMRDLARQAHMTVVRQGLSFRRVRRGLLLVCIVHPSAWNAYLLASTCRLRGIFQMRFRNLNRQNRRPKSEESFASSERLPPRFAELP
jgi:hypothetical protein